MSEQCETTRAGDPGLGEQPGSMLARLVEDPARFLVRWPAGPAVHRRDTADLAELLDRDGARRMLTDPAHRPKNLGMVHQGASTLDVPPSVDHPTHTLVLNGPHLTWPPLRRAAQLLSAELGHRVTANAYLTPPGSTGFGPHWDSHHVMLVQVEGAKTWQLHPPVFVDPLDRHIWTEIGFTPEQLAQVHRDAESVTLTAG
ncbi:JmjC domain-containing protein [Kitasatospora sp. NPDC101155]|uniref:JmjC domain-containing protein n=1 Tax=Kitasatospora sp. NPDC101155 TaxID=3364097 RepID=UPI003825A485